ncbi:MAG: flagellar biosynthetic protein FliO, partial [Gammaproteobacteria bacterium]|nr:flagellar biosynthetic protein FliO [Gammaproteobacteria bacterium]
MKIILQTVCGFIIWLPVMVMAENTDSVKTVTRIEPFSMVNMLNMVMGLVIVLAFILGLAWMLRKYGRLPVSNQVDMKILGGLSLGTRERAVLVQVDDQKLLLGVAPGRVSILQNLSPKTVEK